MHGVYIALPVGLHAEYAVRALRMGKPATSNGNLRLRVGRGNRGDVVEERFLPQVGQIPLMFDHLAECASSGATPITSSEEGVRDLELIARIYEAGRSAPH